MAIIVRRVTGTYNTHFDPYDYEIRTLDTETSVARNDTILTSVGNDRIYTGLGNDVVNAHAGNDFVAGGAGRDTLTGGLDNDVIFTGSGDDIAFGGHGNDSLFGDGNDGGAALTPDFYRSAATDYDFVQLNHILVNGQPIITGFTIVGGNDWLEGGGGDDFVYGGAGNDTIFGDDPAWQRLTAAPGNDALYGGLGNDAIFGGAGNDLVVGDAGNDTLKGGRGWDSLFGGDGNDQLFANDPGDAGDARGNGVDMLSGEGGADAFIFTANSLVTRASAWGGSEFTGTTLDAMNAMTTITDFSSAQGDKIRIDHNALTNWNGTFRFENNQNPAGWSFAGEHGGTFKFDRDNKVLYWDDNGVGRENGLHAIAVLQGVNSLNASDIVVF